MFMVIDMYNWGFNTFIDELLSKAHAGDFAKNPKELREYQSHFANGIRKFGMHPLVRHEITDELRKCGIETTAAGRWKVKVSPA